MRTRTPISFGRSVVGGLDELGDFAALFGGEVPADVHVLHGHVPFAVAVIGGRAGVVAADAVLGPELGAAFGGDRFFRTGLSGGSALGAGRQDQREREHNEGAPSLQRWGSDCYSQRLWRTKCGNRSSSASKLAPRLGRSWT